jgi:hypothetical protein
MHSYLLVNSTFLHNTGYLVIANPRDILYLVIPSLFSQQIFLYVRPCFKRLSIAGVERR